MYVMNCVYFACPACRVFTDAGYRWAYWTLEDKGIVQLGEGVPITSLLECEEYWNPPEAEKSEWLCDKILPTVSTFIRNHADHGLVYVDSDLITREESILYNWTEVE